MNRLFGLVLALLALSTQPALAALGDVFVTSEWLAAKRQAVTLVDVRIAPLYLVGHIDGALHIDKDEFLFTREGVKSLAPTVAEFEALMDRFGITPETTVVAYAEDNNPYAARLVWTLRYHGHEKSYVLDGGYQKWAKEGRATALLPTLAKATSGYKCQRSLNIRAEAKQVLGKIQSPGTVIWDTRKSSEYDGSEVRANRGGHIPGATHLDWTNLQKEVNGVKVLKSEEEIRSLLATSGLSAGKEIIAHCQTGIRSSFASLVLLGLGYPQVQNYDGSWIEWANDPSLPVELGAKIAGK